MVHRVGDRVEEAAREVPGKMMLRIGDDIKMNIMTSHGRSRRPAWMMGYIYSCKGYDFNQCTALLFRCNYHEISSPEKG